jgi:hypothetical protein
MFSAHFCSFHFSVIDRPPLEFTRADSLERGFWRVIDSVSKRDLDRSFNRIRRSAARLVVDGACNIVAANPLFRAPLDDKMGKSR